MRGFVFNELWVFFDRFPVQAYTNLELLAQQVVDFIIAYKSPFFMVLVSNLQSINLQHRWEYQNIDLEGIRPYWQTLY